jgi:hypothetical protein
LLVKHRAIADDSKFEWQDRVLAMIDAKKGPFHLRVTVPRQRGGSTFALNLARGRRYRVMHALELQRLRKKHAFRTVGQRIRKRGKTAVEDLSPREIEKNTSELKFVGTDFEGLVVDTIWSDDLRLNNQELAALQGRCVVEMISDWDPDNINRDVRAEFVSHTEQP